MKIYVKFMVSARCRLIVTEQLNKIGVDDAIIRQGCIEFTRELSSIKLKKLKQLLAISGFEFLEGKKILILEKSKKIITEIIHYADDEFDNIDLIDLLVNKLEYNIEKLSELFIETEGISIQHFITKNKMEKAKELILYAGLTPSQIALKLNFSSENILSQELKHLTGLEISHIQSIKKLRDSVN